MLATISNRQAAKLGLIVRDLSLPLPSAFTFVVGNFEPAFLRLMGSAFTSTAIAIDSYLADLHYSTHWLVLELQLGPKINRLEFARTLNSSELILYP